MYFIKNALDFSCVLFVHVIVFYMLYIWEDNIKMDLQEVGGGGGDWMELTEDRDGWRVLVNTVMNFRVR